MHLVFSLTLSKIDVSVWFCLSHKLLLNGLSHGVVLIFVLSYSHISTNNSPMNSPTLSENTILGAPKIAIQCFINILAVIQNRI